jgi:hypothetical protein
MELQALTSDVHAAAVSGTRTATYGSCCMKVTAVEEALSGTAGQDMAVAQSVTTD